MIFNVSVNTIYHCSLESAFKTPILCDVSKVHTGYGIMPKVTHCEGDDNWGKSGHSKKVFVAKSITQKGGFASVDKVIRRIENQLWEIEVSDFQSWMLGFWKFKGEWLTKELEKNMILIKYSYTLYAKQRILFFPQWIFAKLFWKRYMKKVMENIRVMINNHEPFLYD